jgi:hypothetical protein
MYRDPLPPKTQLLIDTRAVLLELRVSVNVVAVFSRSPIVKAMGPVEVSFFIGSARLHLYNIESDIN